MIQNTTTGERNSDETIFLFKLFRVEKKKNSSIDKYDANLLIWKILLLQNSIYLKHDNFSGLSGRMCICSKTLRFK